MDQPLIDLLRERTESSATPAAHLVSMNRTQFEALTTREPVPRMLTADRLGDDDRTLAYGYTCNRDTFHAYLREGELHVVIYTHAREILVHLHGPELAFEALRPDKRVYPERCDFVFARLMADAGTPLPFTNFNPDAKSARWNGPIVLGHSLVDVAEVGAR